MQKCNAVARLRGLTCHVDASPRSDPRDQTPTLVLCTLAWSLQSDAKSGVGDDVQSGGTAATRKKFHMKRTVFIVMAIAAVGCDKESGNESAESYQANTSTRTAEDNTGKNERDRDMKTLTPEDQGGEGDRKITQLVRQNVVKEYGATTDAANVKIVTVDGVVTLRGPVNSESEQSAIGSMAQKVDGVRRVDNQLEVASR